MAGVFNTIREKYSGALLVVLGISLFGFVISSVATSNTLFGGTDPDEDIVYAGKVADQKIVPQYITQRGDRDILFQELIGGSQGPTDDAKRQQAYQQAWARTVQDLTYNKEYEKLGIDVSDAEYSDMVYGSEPDPMVTQFLGGPDKVREVLKNKKNDKEGRTGFILGYFENDYIIPERKKAKYNALLKNGIFVSKAEAERRYQEDTEKRDIQFLGVSYAAISDSAVSVTDADLKAYYSEHQEEFRQEQPEALAKLCVIQRSPSKADTNDALNFLLDLKPKLRATTQDSAFAAENATRSEERFNFGWQPADEMKDFNMKMQVGDAGKDSVVGPYLDRTGYKLVKVSDVSTNPDLALRKIKIIVINKQRGADTLRGLSRWENTYQAAKADFDKVARDSTEDQNAQQRGVLADWYVPGSYGKEFDAALKGLKEGSIVKIAVPNAYTIVKVEQVSKKVIKLAVIAADITPGEATINALTQRADLLLSDLQKAPEKFDTLVTKAGFSPAQPVTLNATTGFIPGLQQGSDVRQVLVWALKAKSGDVMERSINCEKALVVGLIEKKYTKGYKPFEAVKDQIRPLVINEKKAEAIVAKLTAAGTSDLEQLKSKYGLGAFVATETNISFGSGMVQGVMRNKVVGKAFGLNQNQTSKPIVEKDGVFVVKVTRIEAAPKLEGQGLEDYRKNLQTTKRGTFTNGIGEALKEVYQVVDYRYNHGL